MLTAVDVVDASAGDGKALLSLIDDVEGSTVGTVEQVLGDTAYGEAENRVGCDARGIDLVAPVGSGGDPLVAKDAFTLGEDGVSLTCPTGQVTTDWHAVRDAQGRTVKQFTFARNLCDACPLFARCVHSQTKGRSVTLHFYEGVLRAARERQATPAFREQYRQRARIERKIAELMGQGLRQTRYVGRKKQRLQALWTAAVVNLKRLFTLAANDPPRLLAGFVGQRPAAGGAGAR